MNTFGFVVAAWLVIYINGTVEKIPFATVLSCNDVAIEFLMRTTPNDEMKVKAFCFPTGANNTMDPIKSLD